MKAGDEIPPIERTIDLPRMVAYAGATWDWHRLHYDLRYAEEAGLPAPVVDGQMLGALLAEQLLDWLGPGAFLRELTFRFRSMVFAGETVRCEGEVTAVDGEVVETRQRVLVGYRVGADGTGLVLTPRASPEAPRG